MIGLLGTQPKSIIIALWVFAACLIAADAAAQEDIKQFQIEAQPLTDALKAFAVQADVEVFAPSELVDKHITPSLKGAYDQRTALNILLDGAGLNWRINEFGTILIQASPKRKSAEARPSTSSSQSHDGAKNHEEIVVTARKRHETLQHAPLSIAVLSGGALEQQAFDDLRDYIGFLPGLAGRTADEDRLVLNVRGLAAPIPRIATVGVYVDDVPITQNSTSGGDIEAFDLERVELLRGPQGTLFGEASLGGALRFVTQKPKNKFETKLRSIVSSTKNGEASYALHGAVNIPVIKDVFALRFMGYRRQDGGFGDNVFTGEDNINDLETWGGRLSALLTPADTLTVTGVINYNMQEAEARTNITPTLGALTQDLPGPFGDTDEALYASLTINYNHGWGDITSITGYSDRTAGVKIGFFIPGFPSAPEFANSFSTTSNTNVISQELRLATTDRRSPVSFLAGLYYRQSNTDSRNSLINAPFFQTSPFNLPAERSLASSSRRLHLAAFGEIYFQLLNGLELTLGGRIFKENFDNNGLNASFSGATPKFQLTYRITDALTVYTLASAGYRPGGVNGTPGLEVYKEDTSWNYELGWKSAWLDNRVIINMAAFFIDWQDLQIAVPAPNAPLAFTIDNAGAARSAGIEIDFSLTQLIDGLTIQSSAAWVEAQLAEDALNALEGARLPNAPKVSFSILADYRLSLSSLYDGFIGASYSYNGKQFLDITNLPSPSANLAIPTFIKSNSLLNLRVGISTKNYMLSLFADNALDSELRYGDFVLEAAAFAQRPRTFGVSLQVNI